MTAVNCYSDNDNNYVHQELCDLGSLCVEEWVETGYKKLAWQSAISSLHIEVELLTI